MLFHSLPFLVLFTVTFIGYWTLRSQRLRMIWILGASIVFYARWNPWLVSLVLFTAAFDFRMAHLIERAQAPRRRRALLTAAIVVPLGILAYFKYTNFLLGTAGNAFHWLGFAGDPPFLRIILPLGISFYTFETIAYVVDVYRGRIRAERDILDYAIYLMFFPHLIAGPIVRPGSFLPQTRRLKKFDWNRMHLGARLFMLGLIKKVAIADQMALVADPVFAHPSAYSTGAVWAAVIGYAVQIYCDFSGYSDMAIGIAHTLGFKLPRNFNMPYFSGSVAEFWRRWHITLSTWLRDYLYIPLGGNRGGRLATYRNLMLTMVLGGLWHGAAWTFVLWGFYHGLLLAIHRAVPWPAWLAHRALKPVKIAFTFLLVAIGWVFFRAQSFADAGTILTRMFVPTRAISLDASVNAVLVGIWGVVLAAHLVGSSANLGRFWNRIPASAAAMLLAGGFLLAQLLTPATGDAFIYFQF